MPDLLAPVTLNLPLCTIRRSRLDLAHVLSRLGRPAATAWDGRIVWGDEMMKVPWPED